MNRIGVSVVAALLLFIVVMYLSRKPVPLEVPVASEPTKQGEATPARPTPIPNCERPLKDVYSLGGTLVLTDPKESLALLHRKGGPGFAIRQGEPFGPAEGGKKKYDLAQVDRKRICIRNTLDGTYYFLSVSKVSPEDRRAMGKALGIQYVGQNRFEIPKRIVEREIIDIRSIVQSALAIPEMVDGKFGGFKLVSIESGSVFLTLGLQPNDVLTGANDMKFSNPGDGLTIFGKLRDATSIQLQILRNGVPTTLRYEITSDN